MSKFIVQSGKPFLALAALWIWSLAAAADSPPDPATLAPVPEAARAGFNAVAEANLRAWLKFLASDELEGRGTAQPGYALAARFCASVFEQFGLQPAGDQKDGQTGYFQEFQWIRLERDRAASFLEVQDQGGRAAFRLGEEVSISSTTTGQEIDWSGPWVFAGFGEGAESDAPDDFHGFDLKNETAVVLLRKGKTSFDRKGLEAAGGKRAVVIFDERARDAKGLPLRELPEFLEKGPAAPAGGVDVFYISNRAADRILGPSGWSVARIEERAARGERAPRFKLEGVKLHLLIKNKRTAFPLRNVLALVEGSDPVLKSEVVAIGAHLDHEGTRDGKIFHGADDDASGSAGVLALARAFAENPHRPRRSILLMLFAAEEKGLHGSRYFVEHSPVPPKNIVAEIQMDMIGRNEEFPNKEKPEENTNTVHLVGPQLHSRELHQVILEQNRSIGLSFEYDMEEVYSRSDQINFANAGIPVAFLFTGFHPDYHQPTDTADKINFPKMARIVRLAYLTAFQLADRSERPRLIKQERF